MFKGAKTVIDWLKNQGYEIVIFTTRASKENAKELGGDHNEQIKKVAEWLKDKGIYFDKITGEKLAADFYIDDKANLPTEEFLKKLLDNKINVKTW